MPPPRFRVLLVDPVKLRRDRSAEATRLRFDIVHAGNEAEANAVVTGTIHAIVLTLRQADDNGLALAKKLRVKFGPEPYVVVHGASVPAKSTEERAALAARHSVDLWIAQPIEPFGLEAALWGELVRRFRPPVKAAPTEESVDDEPTWRSLLTGPGTWDNMKKILTKDIGGGKKKG